MNPPHDNTMQTLGLKINPFTSFMCCNLFAKECNEAFSPLPIIMGLTALASSYPRDNKSRKRLLAYMGIFSDEQMATFCLYAQKKLGTLYEPCQPSLGVRTNDGRPEMYLTGSAELNREWATFFVTSEIDYFTAANNQVTTTEYMLGVVPESNVLNVNNCMVISLPYKGAERAQAVFVMPSNFAFRHMSFQDVVQTALRATSPLLPTATHNIKIPMFSVTSRANVARAMLLHSANDEAEEVINVFNVSTTVACDFRGTSGTFSASKAEDLFYQRYGPVDACVNSAFYMMVVVDSMVVYFAKINDPYHAPVFREWDPYNMSVYNFALNSYEECLLQTQLLHASIEVLDNVGVLMGHIVVLEIAQEPWGLQPTLRLSKKNRVVFRETRGTCYVVVFEVAQNYVWPQNTVLSIAHFAAETKAYQMIASVPTFFSAASMKRPARLIARNVSVHTHNEWAVYGGTSAYPTQVELLSVKGKN